MAYSNKTLGEEKRMKTMREFYALTLIIIPMVLMALVSQYMSNSFIRTLAQVLILFFAGVIVRGIIERNTD